MKDKIHEIKLHNGTLKNGLKNNTNVEHFSITAVVNVVRRERNKSIVFWVYQREMKVDIKVLDKITKSREVNYKWKFRTQ